MEQPNFNSMDLKVKQQLIQRLKSKKNGMLSVPLETDMSCESSYSFCALPSTERMFWAQKKRKYAVILPLLLKIEGELDLTLVRQTLYLLALKYPVLRSSFFLDNENIVQQKILKNALIKVEIQFLDCESTEKQLMDQLSLEANESFHSELYPLFKAKVFIVKNALNYMTFTIHHLITDEISSGLLIKDFSLFYSLLKKNINYMIEDNIQSFLSYINLKWNNLNGELGKNNEAYWKDYLQDKQFSPLTLQQNPKADKSINRAFLAVSYEQLQSIKNNLTNSQLISNFSVFFANFALCIKEYFAHNNFIINYTSANRADSPKAFEHMGCFTNSLPMVFSISSEIKFSSFLSQVVDQYREGIAHENINILNIYKTFEAKREAFSEFVFSYLNAGAPEVSIVNAKVESFDLPRLETSYLIFLVLREYSDGIKGFIEYNNNYLSEKDIETFINLFYKKLSQLNN